MNIVDALRQQHNVLRGLLEKTERDPSHFDELWRHMLAHSRNEEAAFLAVLTRKQPTRRPALTNAEQHRVIDWMLGALHDFPRQDERWPVKFGVLADYCRHHFANEEKAIFSEAFKYLTSCEMKSMAEEYQVHFRQQLDALRAPERAE